MPRHVNWGGKCPALTVSSCWPSGKPFEGTKPFAPLIRSLTTAEREILGIRRSVLLSGTSTRSAPAGRRPPKPSRQVHSFMKKTPGSGCALSRNWGRLPVRLMRPGHVRLGTELRVGSFGPVTGGLRVGRQARCPPSILPSLARFRFEDSQIRGLTRRGPLALSLMDQGASKCQLGVHSLPAYLTVLIHVWLEKLDSDHIQMAPSGLPQ